MDTDISIVKKSKLVKFGRFLTVLAFLGLLFSVFATYSIIAVILFWFVIVVIMLCTVFLILLDEGFRTFIDSEQSLQNFCMMIYGYAPYVLGVSISLCVISLLIFFGKRKSCNTKASTIFSCIVLIMSIITLIINFSNIFYLYD